MKIKLYCFPYAGGSAAVYMKWKNYLNDVIELRPVELAGRGLRCKDSLYINMSDMVDDVYNEIHDELDSMPYAFFGHSMGSLIAYETYYRIKEEKQSLPMHIFFSGHRPPDQLNNHKKLSQLNDHDFKKEILMIGGTPKELFDYPELVDFYLPMLRADYEVVDTYSYRERVEKIKCSISILNGKYDTDELCDIGEWRKHTSHDCKEYVFDGGHFYINDYGNDIGSIINSSLTDINLHNMVVGS